MRRDTIDLRTLTPREREVHLSGYGSGYAAGLERGRELRLAEEEAAWRPMAESIRKAGGPFAGVRFSELAALRGEEERASLARAREDLLFRRVVA